MKTIKILALEDCFGNQYEFTLNLEEDKWKDFRSLLILGEELIAEKYGRTVNVVHFNILTSC